MSSKTNNRSASQPTKRRRDILFLNSNGNTGDENSNSTGAAVGGFSFGFTEGHLPVSIIGDEMASMTDSATGAGAASQQQQMAQHGSDSDEETLAFKQQTAPEGAGQDSSAVTLAKLGEAKKEADGAGMRFFFPDSRPLDPQAHADNIRRVLTQVRREAAHAEYNKRKLRAGDNDDDDDDK